MPGIFEDRATGYEAKWLHDATVHFKVMVRRNQLLGRWAAGELGLSGNETDEYADAMVKIGLTGKDPGLVCQKIRDDFHAKKRGQPDQSIRTKMLELFGIASEEATKDLI